MNFICFLALWLLRLPVPAFFHLILGFFNLLPLQGLDGGQILQLLLDWKFDPRMGASISTMISWIADFSLVIGGFLLFCRTGNLTPLLIVIYFLILGFTTDKKVSSG